MELALKKKVRYILNKINSDGLQWKPGKDIKHLNTRKDYGHLPEDFSMKDYENVIMGIMKGIDNDVFIYFVKGFKKDYIVFGDGKWIVIIGEDAIMETSFPIDGDYFEYLSENKGYKYIGTVKEVIGDV